MKFSVQNKSTEKQKLFFQFNNPNLDSLVLYAQIDSVLRQVYLTGSSTPFKTRPYPYHDFVFPLSVESGQSITYLIMAEKRGEIFSTKPELMGAEYFKNKEQNLYLIFGAIVGMMLFNMVVNVFLGISLKDKIHYLYAVYVSAAVLWFFSSIGVDFQLLFPNHPEWFSESQGITGGITMVLMGQLAIVFLRLKEIRGKAYYCLNSAKWLLIFVLPVKTWIYLSAPNWLFIKQIFINLYLLSIFGIAVGMIWAAIVRIRQGYKPAWFYLAAMAYLSISIAITCYIIIGSGDVSLLVSPPTQIQQGLIIETIIIFVGIIYRYNLFKKDREFLANQLATQQLQTAQAIVSAQEEERKRLAQDLHDDVGATLSSLLLHITNPPEQNGKLPELVVNHYERSAMITQKALNDLRNITHNLLPKDLKMQNLFEDLNQMYALGSQGPTQFSVNTDGDDAALNEMQTVTLYRIINELINNILRHAKASQAYIDISITEEQVTLIIEDNGIGFELNATQPWSGKSAGIGLKNVKSRVAFLNGTISIDTNKQGTTIIIVIPLEESSTI